MSVAPPSAVVRGRPLLALLAAVQLATGAWALLASRSWFGDFPGLRTGWVAAHPPFNEHLAVDAGAGFLATGVALAIAAWRPDRVLVRTAAIVYLVHAVPHTTFHLLDPGSGLPPLDVWLSSGGLVVGVLAALALLWTTRRPSAVNPPLAPTGEVPTTSLPPLDGPPPGLTNRVLFAVAQRRLGVVPASWRLLARVPRLLLPRALGDHAMGRFDHVPARLANLAQLRVATLVECAFCIDILSVAASRDGVRSGQLRDLARWRGSDVFDTDERLVLALADAVTATPADVDASLRDALVARFGTEGTVELAATLAHENARARANRVLGVAPQGFALAAGCPLPDLDRAVDDAPARGAEPTP